VAKPYYYVRVAVSPKDAINADQEVTVGEYASENLKGRTVQMIDDIDSLRDQRLKDVLEKADSKTHKLLTSRRFRKD
jgi:hypothetical protein